MKKTSKVFGAIAVSAALALGTAVPAFADTEVKPSTDEATDDKTYSQSLNEDNQMTLEDETEGSSTIVKVSTYTSQLNVTVPLTLPVALDRAGGYGMAPTNYYIQNDSVPNIEVVKADFSIVDDTKWTFKDDESAFAPGDAPLSVTKKGTSASSATPQDDPASVGSMLLQLAPTDAEHFTGDPWTTSTAYTKTSGSSSNTIWTLGSTGSKEIHWTIPGTADNPGEDAEAAFRKLVMTIEASSSTLNADVTAEPVAKVTYTIGLAAAEAEETPGA